MLRVFFCVTAIALFMNFAFRLLRKRYALGIEKIIIINLILVTKYFFDKNM
jgi:hypothetical protein